MIERVPAEHRLRICVAGNLDGIHTRNWVRYFVDRGHEVHGVTYYAPARPPEGVVVHALRSGAHGADALRSFGEGRARSGARPGPARLLGRALPPTAQRLVQLLRWRRAGAQRVLQAIAPDVLHAHYLVEHAFYATSAAFAPYVVSAWGSDVLVDAARSPASRAVARFAASRASLVTANNRHLAREIVLKLGKERAWVQHIVLGVSRSFLDRGGPSVNEGMADGQPTVISTRSLDGPLYNVDVVLRAMALARERIPNARLVVAGEGRLRPRLERLAAELRLGEGVQFAGALDEAAFHTALIDADVFVSVPSSDATSVALLQAMGVGCFPIVSDLPSQQELVEDGVNGLRVRGRDVDALADVIVRALEDGELRRAAVGRNRRFVEEYGVLETNMAKMEAWYYRLAGRAGEAHAAGVISGG